LDSFLHGLRATPKRPAATAIAGNVDGFVQPGFNTGCVPP
jgi:hypothetical protein